MVELRQRVQGHDVIGIVETWANAHINDAELAVEGYNMFRVDRTSCKGGGLLMYVNDKLKSSVCTDMMNTDFKESLWCSIEVEDGRILIGLCYRSTSSDTSNDECLLKLLRRTSFQRGFSHVMIMGDFNFPDIDYEHGLVKASPNASATRFFEETQDLFLIQHVRAATRFRERQEPSTLDYVFTDEDNLIERVNISSPLGKSDHAVLEWDVLLKICEMDNKLIKRNFWKGDYDQITKGLLEINWKEQLAGKTVEEMWTVFKLELLKQIKEYIPLKKEYKAKKKDYISKATKKHMKKRSKAWRKYRQFPSGKNFQEYKKIRNEVNEMVRSDEDAHRKRILSGFKNSPKRFYGYMRKMQTVKDVVTALKKEDGKLTDTDQEVADELASCFQHMFTKEDEDGIQQEEEDPDSGWSDNCITFSTDSVLKKLQQLPKDKAPGPDGLHPMLLSNCAVAIAEPLALIFQSSFATGLVPSDWKVADIVPIFKKGDRNDPTNYRPVSLTSVPCKVMESLIKDSLKEFLEIKGTISGYQHGFMQGRSCLTNLLESLECWTQALDNGYGIDVLYLDYRKAFDSVPHKRLLEKLKIYGVQGKLLTWIQSFLAARLMRVGIRGSFSDWIKVLSGVPQGSVLGPLLFLLFVNDLPDWIKNSMRMFADDVKIWNVISSTTDSKSLQEDLNSLTRWSSKWLLKLNPSKCKVMHIGHSSGTVYYMNDDSGNSTIIQQIAEEKDLGVHLTDDLKPSTQCVRSAAKARSVMGMVKRNFRRLDQQDFLLIYKTYIRPRMEYCVQAWSPHLKKDIECLEKVQRAATKMVHGLRHLPYEDRLVHLGLTTLEERRTRGDLIEAYKIITGKEAVDREHFFQLSSCEYNLRGHSMKLSKQRPSIDVRKFFFRQRVVNEWNLLPQEVVDATSVNQFRQRHGH